MKKNLVRDWMTPRPITIDPKTTLPEAHKLMKQSHIRRLPVVANDKIVGILTLGDVREARPSDTSGLSLFELNYWLARLTVDHIMTRDPLVVAPGVTLREAAQVMLENKIGGLPVVQDDKLVGIITESDIFSVLAQEPEPALSVSPAR